ncbi:MAG: amino acid ABC transporter permease [Ruminiclostridium sp.]|nr:amino acid ABC transporter permease [Ruminiclostridium sp.]
MTNEEIQTLFGLMLEYMVPTLKIFGFTLLYSIPLGMVVALLKMCRFKPVSWLTNIYILIMRGTPLLLQLIVAQYSVPYIIKSDICPGFLRDLLGGVDIRSEAYTFNMMLIAFVLNYAAYFAEIFRGGIQSIPKGQYEAAGALGFNRIQTFFRIILPQVIRRVLPASSNEIITLIKDTSLASAIPYMEIMYIAKKQVPTYASLLPLFMAGLFYFVFAMVLTFLLSLLEKSMDPMWRRSVKSVRKGLFRHGNA